MKQGAPDDDAGTASLWTTELIPYSLFPMVQTPGAALQFAGFSKRAVALRRSLDVLLCAGLLTVSGCAEYWRARASDLADPFGLGLRLGMSVQGNVRATQLVQTGIGWDMGAAWRWQGRELYQAGGVGGEFGLAPLWHQRGVLYDSSSKSVSDDPKVVLGKLNGGWPDRKGFDANHDRRLYDFGVTLQAIVGVDIEFNPVEFADMLLGWFGIDLMDDDAIPEEDAASKEKRSLSLSTDPPELNSPAVERSD